MYQFIVAVCMFKDIQGIQTQIQMMCWLHLVAKHDDTNIPAVIQLVTHKANTIYDDWAQLLSVGSLSTTRLQYFNNLLDDCESEKRARILYMPSCHTFRRNDDRLSQK